IEQALWKRGADGLGRLRNRVRDGALGARILLLRGLGNLVADLARGAGDCLRGLLALLANLVLVQEATSRLTAVLTRQDNPDGYCRNTQRRACDQGNELASPHGSTSHVQIDTSHPS